jgi:hypothetical protein
MTLLSPHQRKSLFQKWEQNDQGMTYMQFRRTVLGGFHTSTEECPGWLDRPPIMVKWCGMWLGIEADGYTHS